jgi:hypothetical protein
MLEADLADPGHVEATGFCKFLSAARKISQTLTASSWSACTRFVTDILERVNDAPRNESSVAWAGFVPFSIHEECNLTFEDAKCFVLVQMIMRRRPGAGRCDPRPHCEGSARMFPIEVNRYFLAKDVEHSSVILSDYCR